MRIKSQQPSQSYEYSRSTANKVDVPEPTDVTAFPVQLGV
jgi:hypothetical protein